MSRLWTDRQLEQSTPPQVKDERGRAVLRMVSSILGARTLSDFYVRDPETCPREALPALIAEFSMEEFIDAGMKEEHIRAVLGRAYDLHQQKGYLSGIRLGLELIGVQADWKQWFEQKPMGLANTHTVDVIFDNAIFNNLPVGDLRHRGAAQRMIDATKRYSQGVDITFIVRARTPVHVGATSRMGGVIRTRHLIPTDQKEIARTTIGAISRLGGVHHTKGLHAA